MIACGMIVIILICICYALIGGMTLIFLVPMLFEKTHHRKVLGGHLEVPIDQLQTHDHAAKTIIYTPPGDKYINVDDKYLNVDDKYKLMAEKIYEENNLDHSFLSDIIQYNSTQVKPPAPPQSQINKYMTHRILTNDYPQGSEIHRSNNIVNIEHTPVSNQTGLSYQDVIDMIAKYIILLNIRDLTKEESAQALDAINVFNSGRLTDPTMKVESYNTKDYTTNTCVQKRSEIDTQYKALHWGQRKLLLSEIDFFNRTAQDIGVEEFKREKITMLYPGSAHGDHLMILMELYPNITLYLWDPARYNNVLYLAEFARRNLPAPDHIKFTDYERNLADKYIGRIFINMELSNADFITYHKNSSTNNIPKNYETKHGFFLDSSIEHFNKYRQNNNDTSKILFVSDIRIYSYIEINSFFMSNNIADRLHPVLRYFFDQLALKDYRRDMDLQKNWFLNSKSDYGLFKFKITLPTSIPEHLFSEYLDGDIVLQTWGPITTTETRLFVKPKRQPTAYYNVNKYNRSMRFSNDVLRLHCVADYTLKSLNIKIVEDRTTMGDIWNDFLPRDKIGLDAVIETHILHDYLSMYKKEISRTDLSLMISDITQTLINKTDQTSIMRYMPTNNPKAKHVSLDAQKKIFDFRKKYHTKFDHRLDYNSPFRDNLLCSIRR